MALAAAMLVAAGLLCLAGCGGQDAGQKEGGSASANANANANGTGTLRVGVRADVVGFGYFNERANNYYGLEIDLARELASRLGYADVEFVTVEPDTRKDMLLAGEVDCLVACYSITDTRTENFDFSPAYYHDRAVIMVENSSLITDVSDLENKTVGIMSGSNTGPLLAIKLQELGMISEIVENADEGTQYDGLYVKQVPSYAELSRELEEGTVDAAAWTATSPKPTSTRTAASSTSTSPTRNTVWPPRRARRSASQWQTPSSRCSTTAPSPP